jgi:hypothetical protein
LRGRPPQNKRRLENSTTALGKTTLKQLPEALLNWSKEWNVFSYNLLLAQIASIVSKRTRFEGKFNTRVYNGI